MKLENQTSSSPNFETGKNFNPSPVSGLRSKNALERYNDPTKEFSNRRLRWFLWYTHHEVQLYRAVLVGLIMLSVIFWVFSLWQWGDYLINGLNQDRKLQYQLSQFDNYAIFHGRVQAQPLQVSGAQVVAGGVNKYDAVSEITNPDPRFLVAFDYQFDLGGNKTEKRRALLLPGQTRLVAFYGIGSEFYAGAANIALSNFTWKRVSPRPIANALNYQEDRLNFIVSDFEFVPARRVPETGPDAAGARFTITNESPYGYRQAEFIFGFYRAQNLIGVGNVVWYDFQTKEKRSVDWRNFAPDWQADNVRVFPVIDIYDPSAYLPVTVSKL